MATLKDVSKLAHVSATTVSIIVNGKAEERHISQKTVDKVNAAVRKLNYQPSISARALRSSEANKFTIGIYWVSDFRSSFLSRFINGIQAAKMQLTLDMNIVICPFKPNELYKETALYQTNAFNAVIIATASQEDLKYIHKNPTAIPAILNNRDSQIYHTVKIDNTALGYKAVQHLTERGVKSVGIVALEKEYHAMNSSTKGFIEACKKAKIQLKAEDIIYTGFSGEDGYQAAQEFLKHDKLPDAIFCDNDSNAIGLAAYFNRHGIKVPDEIQIIAVGIGNPAYTRLYCPSITIVNIPLEKLAEEALMIIDAIAQNKIKEPQHLLFDSVLLQRESTKIL